MDFHSSSFSCHALVANPLTPGLYTFTRAKYNPTHLLLSDINFYTCDQDAFKAGIKQISAEVESPKPEKRPILKQLEESRQFEFVLEDIEAACDLISQNAKSLSFDEKHQALEVLQFKVWVNLTIRIALVARGSGQDLSRTGYSRWQRDTRSD